jgi:hypothetical protein
VISMGMGGVKTCAQCATIKSGVFEVMPVGTYMKKLAERGVNYIVYGSEDVIMMKVKCIQLSTPITITDGVKLETETFHNGNHSILANMAFTSVDYKTYLAREQAYFDELDKQKAEAGAAKADEDMVQLRRRGVNPATGNSTSTPKWTQEELKKSKMVTRSCDIKLRARRMKTVTEYSTDSIGNVKKRSILSIEPDDPNTCYNLGGHCFNYPDRPDLLNLAFPLLKNTSVELSARDVFHSAVIPFPGYKHKDKDYARLIKKFLMMSILNTALTLYDRPAKVATYNLNNARILAIQPELKWITIVVSIFSVLFGLSLILMDLVRLQRANNVMLRKLDDAIHLGKLHFEAIACIVHKTSSASHDREDWDLVPIRFGEDRKTIMDPIGRLMFGTKKDIIKMKLERSYY